MPKIFYLSEILDFALEKEQQSADLYQKLADLADNPDDKALFEKLMRDELGHKAYYAEILASVKEEQSPKVPREGEEYMAYMRQLIEDSRTVKALPEDISSMPLNEILDYAIAREKDSVMFYLGLKQFVPESAKAHIDIIIAEESHHAAVIAGLKE
jgi:rubrerythrin